MPRQRRRERLRGCVRVPDAIRGIGARARDLLAEIAKLRVLRCAQPPDLLLDRPDAADLPDIRRHAPEQQVPRDVERPRRDVPPICLRLHVVRAGKLLRQAGKRPLIHLRVRREQRLARLVVDRRVLPGQLRRRDEPGPREILVPRRLRLPVPQRLGLDLRGRKLRQALEAEHRVAQVGDRSVAVLEVEALEKFLRVMRPHPLDGVADRIGRAAVTREGVGALLGGHGRHRDDAFGRGQDAIITKCKSAYSEFTPTPYCPDTLTGRTRTPGWISAPWRTPRSTPARRASSRPASPSSCPRATRVRSDLAAASPSSTPSPCRTRPAPSTPAIAAKSASSSSTSAATRIPSTPATGSRN